MAVEQGNLDRLQHGIVEISAPPTSLQFELQLPKFQFSEGLRGLRILDIGAGASDLTRTLLERGADAYAVDPRYSDLKDLEKKVKFHNAHAPYNAIDRSARRKSMDRFIGNYTRNPNKYVAAYAASLPFRDDSFDIAVSMNTITVYLDSFYDLLLASVKEGLRIVKKGGTLQLCPFMEREVGFDSGVDNLRLANESRMVQEVMRGGLADVKVIPVINDMNTLILTKTAA